jgi:rod shape-determining protein MreB
MISLFKALTDRFSYDLAIDLGSTNTLIYRKGKGIILDEPSVIAVKRANPHGTEVVHVGSAAQELLAQASDGIKLVRPVRYGMVTDSIAASAMMNGFLDRIRRKWLPTALRVMANVPAEATAEERNTVRRVIRSAGAREVYLLEEPRALALGAGLDISEEKGVMVLDIGGGITEMAVIVNGKVTCTRSLRTGGQHMDLAIEEYLKKRYRLLVSPQTAELIKIQAGEAYPGAGGKRIMAEGTDLTTGMRRFVEVSPDDIRDALSKPLTAIISAVNEFLKSLPGELYVDILDRGIMLAGGGTLLSGIDRLLEREVLMPIVKSKDPLACLVLGTGDALECLEAYRQEQRA